MGCSSNGVDAAAGTAANNEIAIGTGAGTGTGTATGTGSGAVITHHIPLPSSSTTTTTTTTNLLAERKHQVLGTVSSIRNCPFIQ